MFDRLFVAMQFLLPRFLLTSLVYRLARIRWRPVRDAMINGFVRAFRVDTSEVDDRIPEDFATFNAFFVRELSTGSRPVDARPDSIVSPADGTISQAGKLDDDSLLQAKGLTYSLDELFAIDLDDARAYAGGNFATIYLAPYNYHRVHMPVAGKLLAAHYVPGDLFSVNASTVRLLPGLFRRNERLNLHFETAHGPAAVIFVGALNVGSISTPWTGEIRPRKRGVVEPLSLPGAPVDIDKGELLGWFNMGSTVIVVFPEGVASWEQDLDAGHRVRMGEIIGRLQVATR